jgi:lycopene beta-cyclase
MAEADLLILGGGCAGLSLGVRLAESSASARTIIVEARPAYENDRTWCFWRHGPHRFERLVSQSWHRMEVSSPDRRVSFDCAANPYQMISADRFYTEAQQVISSSRYVSLSTGVGVVDPPRFEDGCWHVSTSAGPITARSIIDTRPQPALQGNDALLWQSFFGQEVECDAPVFDPAIAGLMHFVASCDGDIMFRYVLPSSTTRALVETTVFGAQRLLMSDLAVAQARAVDQLCGGSAVRVLRTETGILPMCISSHRPSDGPRYTRAGLMSGAARPSTGYAFQRIQSWAETNAVRIASGRDARGHAPDPQLRRSMDRLFLQVLRAQPARGPELFIRMFGDAGSDRVIRFLSDRGTLADCAIIGGHLPIGLFLGVLARTIFGAERAGSKAGLPISRQIA